jgi:hypothetical protein
MLFSPNIASGSGGMDSRDAPGSETMDTIETADKALRQGSFAAFALAAITFVMITAAIGGGFDERLAYLNDPFGYVDVALWVLVGWGLLRHSRFAALFACALLVLGIVYSSLMQGRPAGLVLGLVFGFYFVRAVRASFAWHRIRRVEDPGYRPTPAWVWVVVPLASLPVVALVGLGMLMAGGVLPDSAVLTGDKVGARHIELLRSHDLLDPDETIVMFYSAGILSVLEDGNLLTDRRVVSYERVDEEIYLAEATYAEIAEIEILEQGGFFSETLILATTDEGDEILLLASTESDGDRRFVEELRSRQQAARAARH